MRPLSILGLSLLLPLLGGCDERTGPGSGEGWIEIEPRGAKLLVADTAVFHFKVYDARGREQPISAKDERGLPLITWSRNPHEGPYSIINGFPFRDPTYTIRANASGSAWLTLDYQGLRDSVEIVIDSHPDISLLSVYGGSGRSCGLDVEGRAHCWGATSALLGSTWTHAPLRGERRFISLMLGRTAFDCGLTPERELYCWYGDGLAYTSPTGLRFRMLTNASSHMCAVTESGTGYCWGSADYGKLGISGLKGHSCEFHEEPLSCEIAGGHRFRTLAAGWFHTCGVTEEYEVYCWGQNSNDQFAPDSDERCFDILYGEASCSTVPVRIPDAPPFDTLVAAGFYTCGLTSAGEAYCWGHNGYSELGDGNQPENSTVPVPVAGGHRFIMLTPRCGLTADGEVYCWGIASGGAGYATEDCWHGKDQYRCNPVPVPVQGGIRFRSISSNGPHVCGIAFDGLPYCWGQNDKGQLGNGDREERRFSAVPIQVLGTK